MKNVLKKGMESGFTIIEVMVVLAVSGAILLAAIYLVGGRQNDTEFTQAINDIQSQIQETINDTINGYYPYSASFQCSTSGAPGNTGQGTSGSISGACTFVGKALQFGVLKGDGSGNHTNPEQYETYTIAGQQTNDTPPSSYSAANIYIPQGSTATNPPLMVTNSIPRIRPYGQIDAFL